MRYLDVCSGYSAATLAFAGFGWECAGYAEIDPFAAAVIAAHHGGTAPMRMPDPEEAGITDKEKVRRAIAIRNIPSYHWGDRIPNFGDFTTIQESDVGPVDLLIGGTPCQSFSQAGKRRGLDDPRGNLTLEFLALAKRIRARWLAWENVPGFLSHEGGRTAGTFFGLLGQLGYGWAYRILDAQFIRVDGLERAVPQRRCRLIVVGCLGNATAAAAVLFDRESLRGDPRPRRRPIEDVAPTIRSSAGKRGGIQDEASADGLVVARPVAPTLDANYGRLQGCSGQDAGHGHAHLIITGERSFAPLVANTLSRERARTPSSDGSDATLIPVVPFDTTQLTNPHNGSNPQLGDPCHALAAKGHPPTIAFTCKDSGQDVSADVAPTLRSMNFADSHANGGGQIAVAFKASHYTRDKDGEPRDVAPPLTADTDKGDQDTLVLVREVVCFNSVQDPDVSGQISGPLAAGPSGLQAQAVALAFQPLQGGESMPVGDISPTLEAGTGNKAPAVAFQERGRPDGRNLESQTDVAYALTSPATGGRRQELNILAPPAPFVFQTRIARNDRGQPEEICPALNGTNAGETSDMRPVLADPTQDGWRVRRLTPLECERLQGVPDHYTHIELKRRQRSGFVGSAAGFDEYWLSQRPDLTREQLLHLCADAPRYRVLGNSYAVNFIRWVGHGIRIVDAAVFGG